MQTNINFHDSFSVFVLGCVVSRFIDSLGDRFEKEHTVMTPTFSIWCCDWTFRRNLLPL